MAIQRVELPEVESIIGDAFPLRDEDAYRREAQSSTLAADAVRGAQMVMAANAGYTEEQFLGQTGSGLAGVRGGGVRDRVIAAIGATLANRHDRRWMDLPSDLKAAYVRDVEALIAAGLTVLPN